MTKDATWDTTCKECGMRLHDSFEYHPYAACLMFKQCHDRDTVLANLNAVLEHAKGAVEPTAESVSLDYQLPCDVRLPPAATIGKGCTLRTLMHALRFREKQPAEFVDERTMAIRRALTELHRPVAGVTVSNEHEHATYVSDDGPCTTCNDSGWDCELQKPCDCDKGDLHRESSENRRAESK